MNPALAQLKDIHLPHAITMWPVAPGWIILLAIVLGGGFYASYIFYKRIKRQRTIKFALSKLKTFPDLLTDNPQNINIAAEISTLIRRTALYYFPRETIAGLAGQEWVNFLNRSGNGAPFTDKAGQILLVAPYSKQHSFDLLPLISATENWLLAISSAKSPGGK